MIRSWWRLPSSARSRSVSKKLYPLRYAFTEDYLRGATRQVDSHISYLLEITVDCCRHKNWDKWTVYNHFTAATLVKEMELARVLDSAWLVYNVHSHAPYLLQPKDQDKHTLVCGMNNLDVITYHWHIYYLTILGYLLWLLTMISISGLFDILVSWTCLIIHQPRQNCFILF